MSRLQVGVNDLATRFPDVAEQAASWDPSRFLPHSNKKVEWKCRRDHHWMATIANRVNRGSGCPYCEGNRVIPGETDFATLRPDLAIQIYGWDPREVSLYSNQKLEWICELGHIWITSPNNRKRGQGCPFCSNRRAWPGFNDLATTHPQIALSAYRWNPSTVVAMSDKQHAWVCESGHIWESAVKSRSKGVGCPSCADYGFQPAKPSYLYLMRQPEWGLMQIGITNANSKESRTKRHSRKEWILLDKIGPLPGEEIQDMESTLKRWLRSENIQVGRKPDGSKFDGYTESWYEQDLSVETIDELQRMSKTSKEWIFDKGLV